MRPEPPHRLEWRWRFRLISVAPRCNSNLCHRGLMSTVTACSLRFAKRSTPETPIATPNPVPVALSGGLAHAAARRKRRRTDSNTASEPI
jgi:hypothetical protein